MIPSSERTPDWHKGYDVGYQDGESSGHADWVGCLNDSEVVPEGLNIEWASDVVTWVMHLDAIREASRRELACKLLNDDAGAMAAWQDLVAAHDAYADFLSVGR